MGTTEHAELGTKQYLPFAAVLEGFDILAKNEGFPWIRTRVKIGLNSKMPKAVHKSFCESVKNDKESIFTLL